MNKFQRHYFTVFPSEGKGTKEPETDVVPIIVGSILSVIIAAVLIWYLAMRFKNRNKMT